MNKFSAATTQFAFILLCSCVTTTFADSFNPHFVAEAERQYRIATAHYRADPGNVDAVVQFARASFDRAEFATDSSERANLAQAAIDSCEHALTQHESVGALHYYLAMNDGQLARTKTIGALKLVHEMEREFERAIELNSRFDYGGPDRNLGMLYLDAPGWPTSIGNHSKARQHLMRAVQIAPDYPENHLDLLEAYLRLDDQIGAQREGQKLFALLPKAREKFVGEEWASSWADWETRWHKFETRLTEKPHSESPHQKK
jgi:tetratricopeptide (TPR) repeat protein